MEVAAFIIAVLAMLTGGGSLAWQVYTWKQQRRPDVRVSVRHMATTQQPTLDAWDKHISSITEEEMQSQSFFYELTVVVVNHGATTEVVEEVGIATTEHGAGMGGAGPARTEDVELPPGGVIKEQFSLHQLPETVRKGGAFVGYATLVSGPRVEARDRLVPEMLTVIEKANRT